ncbi:hypothetical protein INR76_09150 [Marixanthomonas sp. SCSIO 43207]|uniref:hypothetical protein n=1 Tax=Marixanthomonas sp. SCSIO 43207 TaxID=2779360 RepID=UPI001CA81794|nr:hypothetical protein [Marixanthomonas sp. SCSIO 43207]UAB80282.1 hypothetical protein INR76_09150 [Marixanthomonas sp. SCSIO 43207]
MSTLVNIVLAAVLSFLGAKVQEERKMTDLQNTIIQCQHTVDSTKAALLTKNEAINCK